MKKNFRNFRENKLMATIAKVAGFSFAKAASEVAKCNENKNLNNYQLLRKVDNDVSFDVNVKGELNSPDITGTENGHLKLSINSPILGEVKLEFDSESTYTCNNESIKIASQETRENLKATKQFMVDCMREGAAAMAEAILKFRSIDEPSSNDGSSSAESNDGFKPVE